MSYPADSRVVWPLALAAAPGVFAGLFALQRLLADVRFSEHSEEQSIGTLLLIAVFVLEAISLLPLLGLFGAKRATSTGFTLRVLAFVPGWLLTVLALQAAL